MTDALSPENRALIEQHLPDLASKGIMDGWDVLIGDADLNTLLTAARTEASASMKEEVERLTKCADLNHGAAMKATAELVATQAQRDGLLEAVTASGRQFRAYASQHAMKGTPEADAKALVNIAMAEKCERAHDACTRSEG